MKISLIIFDLDGTLVDTSRDIMHALNYAIRPFSNKILTVEETIGLIGEGVTRLVEKVMDGSDLMMWDEVIERFLLYYELHIADQSIIYPGVKETLTELRDYKMAVISNKRENLSKKLLDQVNLLHYFDLVVGSDTTPERKPSPVPVIYSYKNLGFKKEETVIVGDSNYDIEAGKGAGVKTIAVTYGYKDRIYLLNADYLIDKFDDLLPVIDRISYKLI
ncbi:MAG: HAD-IA family hydrolase [Nitrospirae bacterium]|nr:HAD-IA family hydrolase [Nitrospirota bacterium]